MNQRFPGHTWVIAAVKCFRLTAASGDEVLMQNSFPMNYCSSSKILVTKVLHSEFLQLKLFLGQSGNTNLYSFSPLPQAESCSTPPAKLPMLKLQPLEAQSSPQAAQHH